MSEKICKTAEDWQQQLTPEQFSVTRPASTMIAKQKALITVSVAVHRYSVLPRNLIPAAAGQVTGNLYRLMPFAARKTPATV